MKTSYFAKAGGLPNAVCICAGPPQGFKGKVYKPLAPSWDLVLNYKNGDVSEGDYIIQYYHEVLGELDPAKVVADLGEDAILCCYEGPGKFCHRRLVAEWLENRLGMQVPELE
jgi:hypothetical protein